MYIAKELPLPRAGRNVLFNPSELYSMEIDVSETPEGLIVKTKKALCISRNSGAKKMVSESNYRSGK
ncbi:MAG: hypothetical protein GXY86_06865 [Firmicutes bacterium]|nr:hypothetical protein [Bacillota bacterium]